MQFILKGFTQDREFRVFAFEGIAADRVRSQFTVRADLSLSRRYGIRLQELPLMCREVLEHREEGEQEHAITFGEAAMNLHATNCIAARALAALKKKPYRKPVPETATVGTPLALTASGTPQPVSLVVSRLGHATAHGVNRVRPFCVD